MRFFFSFVQTAKEEGPLMRQNSLPLPETGDGMNGQVESESEAATELEVATDTSENEEAEENVSVILRQ